MFVTAENFDIEPYRLHNLDDEDSDFIAYANKEERKRLIEILGVLLYDAFIEACFDVADGVYTPKEDADIAQHWKDLRDGARYQYEEKSYQWEGMEETLTPYIFSRRLRHSVARQKSGSGVTVASKENSTGVNPTYEISESYNDFSAKVGDYCNQKNTLYGFLYNSGDTYLDVVSDEYDTIAAYMEDVFKAPGRINNFGI